jgi:hypothetical protein
MVKKISYSAPQLIDLSLSSAKGDCASGSSIQVGNCADGFNNDNDCLSGNQAGLGFCTPDGSAAGLSCDTGAGF